ncbi:MAG: hypothetical protein A2V66_11060 [Ignavibacteria bacterium RBG_13_36_8]|nr:MAG: hypothetical protein A2V66_11060 [Ignavibacteria bacterium RBG_13_36_8]
MCKNKLSFKLPQEIIDATIKGDLVIFAGAGISTENYTIFKETLYDDVKYDLELDKNYLISFPELMSRFCKTQTNGRQQLLEKIKYRFDYCHQFSELYRVATRFHSEIAPFWMINNIITTNWDDYFERECNAIPMVTAEDFAFYKVPQRKVFKIHGSISNYGSIVATTEDYEKCYKELNKGLLGSYIKTLLATKLLVFVGYSFRDYDFNRIYNFLRKEMKDVIPHSYIITLDEDLENRINPKNTTVIKTDGIYFFSTLRKHFENKKIIIPEENFKLIYFIEDLRHAAHDLVMKEFQTNKCSNLIFCAMYQDGIQHALDYLKFKSKSGESYNLKHLMDSYFSYKLQLRKKISKARNYMDLAYIDGYIQGLSIPFAYNSPDKFPFFYLFGKGPITNSKLFKKAIDEGKIFHQSAEAYGKHFFKELLKRGNELVPHHRPFI